MLHILKSIFLPFFLIGFGYTICIGQSNVLEQEVSLNVLHQTVVDHLSQIEQQASVQISYSSNQVDLDNLVLLSKKTQPLALHLLEILAGQDLTFVNSTSNRIIIKPDNSPKWFKLTGTIHDDVSGEPLVGAVIRNFRTRDVSYSDEDGFFSIRVSNQLDTIGFALIGYSGLIDIPEVVKHRHNKYLMKSTNIMPLVLITSSEIDNNYTGIPGQQAIYPRNIASYSNFLGDNNIDQEIKNMASIQSGNEGQSGFYVRGGGSDQNLILYEGVPLYESSHTAGLSSIFISDALKDIMVYTEGFPARYGGRLSSIVDVKLKSGKSDTIQGSYSAALSGTTFQLNGPLTDRISFNVSSRLSWINLYVDPILRRTFSYDDSDIRYSDINAKVHMNISPTSHLSLSYYRGSDHLELYREGKAPADSIAFLSKERSLISWKNELLAMNYTNVLNSKWYLKAHISGLGYRFGSRGSYTFESIGLDTTEIDIISYSKINDINANANLTYHSSDQATLKMGVGRIIHQFTPTIKQSRIIRDINPVDVIDGDSTILANESSFYLEGIFHPNEKLHLTTGIRLSYFDVRGKEYSFTEPRFSLSFFPRERHRINFAFSQMAQYHHRLVNPSLGLPSDLWVPSTENIPPQFSTQFSLSYSTYRKNNYQLSIAAYYKTMDNLLDYSNSFDLFYSVVNEGNFIPSFNSSNEWERKVSSGSGLSRGIEFSLSKVIGRSKMELTYVRSKSTRNFEEIDGGAEFFYTFDRTHDVNFSCNIRLSDKWDFAASWIYGTNKAFTLALEESETPDGLKIITPTNRNNYRLSPYHHLDLTANYLFKNRFLSGRISFGTYNVYNRTNPYYAFLYRPTPSAIPRLRLISILPFIPHISLKTNW